MKPTRIFVEGDADKCFLDAYIQHCFPTEVYNPKMVVSVEGKDKLTRNLPALERLERTANTLQSTTDQRGTNLVIFDADLHPETRRSTLLQVAEKTGTDFAVFLLPNDQDAGALEKLLLACVPADNLPILACFDDFKACVQAQGRPDRPFFLPLDKSKVFAYLEALIPHSKREMMQDSKRDYLIPEHWNLDVDYLKPLRAFLSHHLLGAADGGGQ